VAEDLDDACWELLHAARLRGVVDDGDELVAVRVVEIGFAARSAKGIRLTPEGRTAHTAWARVQAGDAEATLEHAYQRFPRSLNCVASSGPTDWQCAAGRCATRPRRPTYDWAIVDRLDRDRRPYRPGPARGVRDGVTRFGDLPAS
jgi:hypothetical protein